VNDISPLILDLTILKFLDVICITRQNVLSGDRITFIGLAVRRIIGEYFVYSH